MAKKTAISGDISGQSMVMMVVMLSTAAIGAATLATFLIVSGFRNISSASQSMNAIFAADSGIECVLFREFGYADYNTVVSSVCPSYTNTPPYESQSKSGTSGSFKFKFNRDQSSAIIQDWSSFGEDINGRTKRVLNIRFTKRG